MADLTFTWQPITLNLRNPFHLAHGTTTQREIFLLRLARDEGMGEASIPPYYNVSSQQIIAAWENWQNMTRALPDEPAQVGAWIPVGGPAPARCALEMALYDRIGRNHGLSLHALLGLPAPIPQPTSFTIAIDTPEAMAAMARRVASYPVLKIKLGSDDDLARLSAVRAARPDARLRVDANAAWTYEQALRHLEDMEPLGLEMIEQPLARNEIEAMGRLQSRTTLPIVADESLQTLADLERLARAGVRGINIKLMKVGGISSTLYMLHRAKGLGLQILLGCMIETSLGVTAAAHLASLADWLDLDAPLLISNDPFLGVTYDEHGVIHLPERPGIGATLL